MTEQFKVGDLVYCPTKTRKILQVGHNPYRDLLDLVINIQGRTTHLSRDGRTTLSNINPIIFHATPENHQILCKLYGEEFEAPPAPPKPKTPKEIIQAMLGDGWGAVPCLVSDDDPNLILGINFVELIDKVNQLYWVYKNESFSWRYAQPIDLKTLKNIVDYVDGEIITE